MLVIVELTLLVSAITNQVSNIMDINEFEDIDEWCRDHPNRKPYFSWLSYVSLSILVSTAVLCFVFAFFIFAHLLYLMKRQHILEFKRQQTAMVIVLLVASALMAMSIVVLVYHYQNENDTVRNNIYESIWVTIEEKNRAQKIEMYFSWLLQVPNLVLCITVIKLKSTKDPI